MKTSNELASLTKIRKQVKKKNLYNSWSVASLSKVEQEGLSRSPEAPQEDTLEVFAFDTHAKRTYSDLDECLDDSHQADCFPIRNFIRGQRPSKKTKTENLKPMVFVEFRKTRNRGRPLLMRALLDSGGAGSLMTKEVAEKLALKTAKAKAVKWTTPAGDVTTNATVTAEFRMTEFHEDKDIVWNCQVTRSLGNHDMIIGRDLLEFLGIDVLFSSQTVAWDCATLPFKDMSDDDNGMFHINEPDHPVEANDCLKRILEAKYEAANLEQVCREQDGLNNEEQQQSLTLLAKCESTFDGTLGT